MEDANVTSIRHQGEVEIAKTQVKVMQAQLDEAKADTVRIQAQLDASRIDSAALQVKLGKAEEAIAGLPKVRSQN
jgi:sialic acid synthase SpsE